MFSTVGRSFAASCSRQAMRSNRITLNSSLITASSKSSSSTASRASSSFFSAGSSSSSAGVFTNNNSNNMSFGIASSSSPSLSLNSQRSSSNNSTLMRVSLGNQTVSVSLFHQMLCLGTASEDVARIFRSSSSSRTKQSLRNTNILRFTSLHSSSYRSLSKSCLIHNHTNNNTQATRSLFSIPKQPKQNNNDHRQTMINTQEIEVKITLLSKADYDKFEQHMGEPKAIIEQENIFFDGSKQEITKPRSMIRLRFFKDAQGNEKCVLTHKGKANISQGISSVEEQEESVDANDARAAVKDPSLMKQWKGELMDMIRDTYKIEEYVCLGGFKNLRKKYDWEGYVLEFDQVTYPFGMNYEIEVETADAAILKPKLTQLLDSLNIQYQDSKRSKFANFFSGSIAL